MFTNTIMNGCQATCTLVLVVFICSAQADRELQKIQQTEDQQELALMDMLQRGDDKSDSGRAEALVFHPESNDADLNSTDVVRPETDSTQVKPSCPGLAYSLPSPDAGQGPVRLVLSSKEHSPTVTVSLTGRDLRVTFGDLSFGHQDRFEVKLSPNEERELMSEDSETMGVLRLASDLPIHVTAGTSSGAKVSETLSPLLPHAMLGRTHVVLMPERSRSPKVKVTSLDVNTTIDVWFSTGARLEVALDLQTHTWSHDQTCDLVIQSNRPVIVVQMLDRGEDGKPEMSPVPPVSQWRNFYEVGTPTPQTGQRSVSITIRTRHISGFLGTSTNNLDDVASGLRWKKIGETQFSTSRLQLDGGEPIQFRHFDPDVAFRVTEAGLEGQSSYLAPTSHWLKCGELSAQAKAADLEPVEESLALLKANREAPGKTKRLQKRSVAVRLPVNFLTSTMPPGSTSATGLPSNAFNLSSVLHSFFASGNLSMFQIITAPSSNASTTLSSPSSWFSSTFSSTASSTAAAAGFNVLAGVTSAPATTQASESDSGTSTALIAGAGAGAVAAVGVGAAVAAVIASKLSAAGAAVAPGAAYAAGAGTGQAASAVAGSGYTAGASAAGNGTSSMAGSGQTLSAFHSGPVTGNGAPPPGTTMVNVGPV